MLFIASSFRSQLAIVIYLLFQVNIKSLCKVQKYCIGILIEIAFIYIFIILGGINIFTILEKKTHLPIYSSLLYVPQVDFLVYS